MTALLSTIIIVSCAAVIGCASSNMKAQQTSLEGQASTTLVAPGPQVWVYKTRGDYENLVPVTLNAERTEIIAYPHPTDLRGEQPLPLPTRLAQGYLLDNRGVTPTTAFLSITYNDYARLKRAPSKAELLEMIKDRDPFVELCNCGVRTSYSSIVDELNAKINANTLRRTCTIVK